MTATTTSDPDCNRVSFFPAHPNTSYRCTQQPGHGEMFESCWVVAPAVLHHKHRAPVPTVEDLLNLRPQGGRHRAHIGAASGPNAVDSELRRRLVAARAGSAVVEA